MKLKFKIIFLLSILVLNFDLYSYKEKEKIIIPLTEQISYKNSTIKFISIDQTTEFLKSFLNSKINGQELKLISQKQSPVGMHLNFKHYLYGIEIFQSSIQANFNQQGILYSIIFSLAKFETIIDKNTNYSNKIWVNTDGGLKYAYLKFETRGKEPVKNLYDSKNNLLFTYNTRRYSNNPDSMVTAMVYLPNPIVAANVNYGGEYRDNGDVNNQSLQNSRNKVRLPLKFENGKFYLTNGLITIKNLHDPSVLPVTPTDTFINYTRDQSGFEDINVFYHINTMTEYIKNKGFENMLDSAYIDSHGSNGDDNSFCDPSLYPIEIEYGTGNVDDGEDGQVIIHEFGHMLSAIATSTDVIGAQRNAMEEGQADYLCMSYTGSYSSNKKGLVFSWDGHNEFWDGFRCNTSKTYDDLTGIKDDDREVWSTALMCINDKLGRNKSDSIILSSFFQQAPNSTMPQMAKTILKNDSILFGGKHVAAIWQCFTDRGILDTVPWYLIKINKLNHENLIKINNSYGFSCNLSPLRIEIKYPDIFKSINISGIDGKIIKSYQSDKEIYILPENFTTGIYFISFNLKNGNSYNKFKVIKF
ncbi:MAG: hypothetical protein IT243_10970 [Bacteroidia bacterium]|nr:hypothetical protein [Bacteroidia bacterium]